MTQCINDPIFWSTVYFLLAVQIVLVAICVSGSKANAPKEPSTGPVFKLSSDRQAVVSTAPDVKFMPMDNPPCPLGAKVILLTEGGVAVIGKWNGKDTDVVGWFPVPRAIKPSR